MLHPSAMTQMQITHVQQQQQPQAQVAVEVAVEGVGEMGVLLGHTYCPYTWPQGSTPPRMQRPLPGSTAAPQQHRLHTQWLGGKHWPHTPASLQARTDC